MPDFTINIDGQVFHPIKMAVRRETPLIEGWAKAAYKGDKAHYWVDVTDQYESMIAYGERLKVYRSLCHIQTLHHSKRQPMLESEGSGYEKCKRCRKALKVRENK